MVDQVFIQKSKVFFSYSHKDERLRDELEKHLSMMKRNGTITSWHDRRISTGSEWAGEIDERLEAADIILLLVSSDFMASDYCYDKEMLRALERHENGTACVIPIVLRPVEWRSAPFSKLQVLPRNAKPITEWANQDSGFQDVARGIREAVQAREKNAQTEKNKPATDSWHVRIEGTIEEFDQARLDYIVQKLRDLSGDINLTISNVRSGSVIIEFDGNKGTLKKLIKSYDLESLSKHLGCTVEALHSNDGNGSRRIQGVIKGTGEKYGRVNDEIIQENYPKKVKNPKYGDLPFGQLQLKEELIDVWGNSSTLWGSNIYQHCLENGYEPEKNLIAEEGKKKLLHDDETLAMMLVAVYAGHLSKRFVSRRELSIMLDKDNSKARDTKIVKDLEKLKRFGLLIHKEPSHGDGERGARYIEPTERLINFFNKYWKIT